MGIEFAIEAQFLGDVAHEEHDAAGLAAGVGDGGEGGCSIKLAAVTPDHRQVAVDDEARELLGVIEEFGMLAGRNQ